MGHYKNLSTPWKPISAYLTHDAGCRCDECRAERRQPQEQPKPKWFKVPVIRSAECARCGNNIYPSGWTTCPYDPFVCGDCRGVLEALGLTTKHLREEQSR
jgi:hypothetical protein